jgi:hypothetical protein
LKGSDVTLKKKLPSDKNPNPNTQPTPHNHQPSMDTRDGHGLSKEEALRAKK